jgi:hypothetical protein
MKRLFAILMILSMMLCAVGCEGSGDSEHAIKKAYIEQLIPEHLRDNYTPDDIPIWSYGTYNGCTVGYFGSKSGGAMMIIGEKVGNYNFTYPSSTKMLAYKGGVFKSLPEAYDLGWLDDDAVKQIHEKHKQEYYYVYDEADN